MSFFNRRKRKKSTHVYDQKTINEIVFAIDFLTPFNDLLQLKKTGKDYVSTCPICQENNHKHFRVSPSNKLYKCFNCGIGGSTIQSFIMRFFDCSFDKALLYLNNRYIKKYLPRPERNDHMKNRNSIDEDLPF